MLGKWCPNGGFVVELRLKSCWSSFTSWPVTLDIPAFWYVSKLHIVVDASNKVQILWRKIAHLLFIMVSSLNDQINYNRITLLNENKLLLNDSYNAIPCVDCFNVCRSWASTKTKKWWPMSPTLYMISMFIKSVYLI